MDSYKFGIDRMSFRNWLGMGDPIGKGIPVREEKNMGLS